LADKSAGATERQTRNGAGKTSLIELIHFLTGSAAGTDSIFRTPELSEYRFAMAFDLRDSDVVVERTGQAPAKVTVEASSAADWPFPPSADKSTGRPVLSNTHWTENLGALMFRLSAGPDENEPPRFGPSFRSLFSYFVRRQFAGAFISPIKQSSMQQPFDSRVAISYLLGLDWTIPMQWQELRERERQLGELRKAARNGALSPIIGTVAELRPSLAVAEEQTRQLREQVRGFQVLPQYRGLEIEASEITRRLGQLADGNTVDRQVVAEMEQALRLEADAPQRDLERLYEEAGVVLAGAVVRRFDDVRRFHESVVANRRSYLSGELQSAQQRIAEREQEMGQIAARQDEVMAILQSHGALEQFAQLQAELSRKEADTQAIRQRYKAAEQLEGQKTQLDIERAQLLLRLRQDYHEQEELVSHAIVVFQEISSALYEEAGSLTIRESLNGPKFDLSIPGAKSKGISNMQIFCFDMMLTQICAERGMGPGFLVHDSHLFDGVDERQIAKALHVGSQLAESLGFQYLVTMNSDDVPRELPEGFDLSEHILPVRLTDDTEDGGLFGLRF
jgi:uncharacterized protein YydD (DUF2326 family)